MLTSDYLTQQASQWIQKRSYHADAGEMLSLRLFPFDASLLAVIKAKVGVTPPAEAVVPMIKRLGRLRRCRKQPVCCWQEAPRSYHIKGKPPESTDPILTILMPEPWRQRGGFEIFLLISISGRLCCVPCTESPKQPKAMRTDQSEE